MTAKNFFRFRLYFTALVTLTIWLILIWDHFHGGVPSHHLLQRKDLPAISNWWGAITIPLLTWFLIYKIQKRIGYHLNDIKRLKNISYVFIGALSYGMLLSIFFTFGIVDLPFYMLIGLIILALFLPIYRAECFLGFVLGMTYTFGGVLPIGIASILALIGAVLFMGVRLGLRLIPINKGLKNKKRPLMD